MSLAQPLAPYRVLEIGSGPGSHAARVLGDLGAEVVKIEPPQGDPLRNVAPLIGGTGATFLWYNASKKGVTLDLEDPANQATVRESLANFDVLIDANDPGYLAAHGLDPEELLAQYPELIISSVSSFGQTGPYRDWKGSGLVEFAIAGSLIRAGLPDRAPTAPPYTLPWAITGVTAASVTVAALFDRNRTGKGDWLDTSVFESIEAQADWSVASMSVAGGRGQRAGAGALFQLYPAADGWVRVINISAKQWIAFKNWLGNPEEISGPEWDNPLFRGAHLDVQERILTEAFKGRNKVELYEDGQKHGVGIVPVYTPQETMEDDHVKIRKAFVKLPTDAGEVRAPGAFVRMNDTAPMDFGPAPKLGAGTEALAGSRQPLKAKGATGYPLAGVRVIEVGSGAVAPEITRLLGEYGADVIKLESRRQMDFMRLQGANIEASGGWTSSNRSKRSVLLDLKSEEGSKLGQELLKTADVVVENNTGGVMDRIGMGYENAKKLNPKVVYLSSQAFGATGPAAGYGGFGPTNQAISGTTYLWNHPDVTKPEGTQFIHPDHLLGRMGQAAVMAALDEVNRTGKGQHIDMGQAEFSMACIAEAFMEADAGGPATMVGNTSPQGAPWGVFPCVGEDMWVAITIQNDEQWRALRTLVGEEMWDAFETEEDRFENRDLIEAQLAAWTSLKPATAVMRQCQAAGIPAGAANSTVDAVADLQLQYRGFFVQINHPAFGTIWLEGVPYHTRNMQLAPSQRAPLWGEHTDAVLSEWLGMDAAAIDSARKAEILQ